MKDYSDKTDEELLREYHLEKNPQFLNIIFSRYTDVGFRTALRYMRNQSDAEDVLQLAFIQFLQNLHHFREGSTTVKPWLMKMIVNASICKLREQKQRTHRQQKVASQKFSQEQQEVPSIETLKDKEELKQKIQTCVSSLPEKYRSPIWLILYEGFSYPEVASVLALPEKTVRTQVARGIDRLRQVLGSYGSVLSIDAMLVLIAESKLEVAPTSLKAIINSPEFYQSASTKIINSASRSSRILVKANTKTWLFSYKILFALATFSLAVLGSVFIFKKQEVKTSLNNSQPLSTLKIEGKVESNDTNRTWSFINEKDRDLPLIMGKWEWSNKLKGMLSLANTPLMISLPIAVQKKAFMIECSMIIDGGRDKSDLTNIMSGFWVKEKRLLKHDIYLIKPFYSFDSEKKMKLYFYNGYVCSFNGSECGSVSKYSDDLAGANVFLIGRNYIVKKISSVTFETPPAELLKAIESFSNKTYTCNEEWLINEAEFLFK